ncbi:MAG: GMC family oxidoreductase, partial [Candidatus Marinimicrobia bacterium]|nr:GMC family oxidoreductase [Candidatus Neomarinimicrobiota bacterium]
MNRISSPIQNMKEHYSVVVVGSGYGGGVSASRLARTGQSVCVLERGKEFLPGEFPDTLPEATEETQLNTQARHIGSKTGLFDFNINDEMNVLVGCGLGGTSLINANVVIKADPRVFEDPVWPEGLIKDLDHGIARGYERAIEMLKPSQYPNSKEFPPLKKLGALEKSANFMNEDFYRVNIAVNFDTYENDLNHVGVKQTPCIMCGDCVSGCNHTSKNTVQMNYLPDARNHGAEIFTEVNVRYLEKQAGKWVVHFKATGMGREKFDASTLFLRADIVILAAGTLGSTEILLRSKQNGLTASDMLGKHFSGNGDLIAFGYNNDEKINGIGWGNRTPDADNPVGPCITSIIDTRKSSEDYEEGMCIEDGTIPGALSAILPLLFSTASKFIGEDTDEGLLDFVGEKKRELESVFLVSAYRGAVNNTQTYLVMCHDGCGGVMTLQDDRLRITWPGIGKDEIFIKAKKRLIKATEALGGTYVPNPTWTKLLGHNLVTVHPLGGCIMAKQSSDGVVNHKGQVFASKESDEVHRGLYVLDGAVIPTSLGTNPLLTISAIAERNVALIANDHGWRLNYDLPSRAPKAVLPSRVGIQFTETMGGYFSTKIKEDYQRAAELGKTEGSTFEFTVTVISNDLEQMLQDERHQATLMGTVSAPALSKAALTVTEGVFNLLIEHPDEIETRLMRYDMK